MVWAHSNTYRPARKKNEATSDIAALIGLRATITSSADPTVQTEKIQKRGTSALMRILRRYRSDPRADRRRGSASPRGGPRTRRGTSGRRSEWATRRRL